MYKTWKRTKYHLTENNCFMVDYMWQLSQISHISSSQFWEVGRHILFSLFYRWALASKMLPNWHQLHLDFLSPSSVIIPLNHYYWWIWDIFLSVMLKTVFQFSVNSHITSCIFSALITGNLSEMFLKRSFWKLSF